AGFIDELEITGTPNDDTIGIDLATFQIPIDGLLLRGREGMNTLELSGDGTSFDFTHHNTLVSDFHRIDLSSSDKTTISLDAQAIAQLSPLDAEIELLLGVDDAVLIDKANEWRLDDPIVVNNQFRLVAENQLGIERIEAVSDRPWQNFLNVSDINNNGAVTANDALVIINELARRLFSEAVGTLKDPLDVPEWPGFYYDQNGDERASAVDALRVINQLARVASGDGGAPEAEWIEVVETPPATIAAIAQSEAKISSFAVNEDVTPHEVLVGDTTVIDVDSVDQALLQW
ncbi:MAG: hypothetical protein HKN47_28790, partial [Pirellulaceae bacterium]|nr:hypothetical protein [Pirellulaceae bacterium]